MLQPTWPAVVLAVVVGVSTIVTVSAYGADSRPAGYAGAMMALLMLVWDRARRH